MTKEKFETLLNDRTIYGPEEIDYVIEESGILEEMVIPTEKYEIVNASICFDIETSSFYKGTAKHATMYAWTLCICGMTIIGRTWGEFLYCINHLAEVLECGEVKHIVVYVHNLSYEFQWIMKKFNFVKVFAIDRRKPIYAITENGIEFHCSYMLSGCKLEDVPKFMNTYDVKKLVGDLDYDKLRHTKTCLTDKELMYIVNDGKTVCAYIQEQIEKWGDVTDIPMTKTGIVRQYARNICLNGKSGYKYKQLMKSLTLTPRLYELCKEAFAGGFTHANCVNSVYTNEQVASYDFSSSYPSVICAEKFPMGRPKKVVPEDYEDFVRYINLYCCVFEIEFVNIKIKDEAPDRILSASRCKVKKGAVLDNGRIERAEKVITTITDVDLWSIERFYDFDDFAIGEMWIWEKRYLPKSFIECVLDLYEQKTKLKGVDGKEIEYSYIKELLNSFYGMMVTDIARDSYEFSDMWEEPTEPNLTTEIGKYNKNKNRFLYYPWGVFVTAYARKNLFENMLNCGDDYIYSDTDSIKIMNKENHIDEIEAYNERVKEKLTKMCEYYKIDTEKIEPVTIKGKKKPLGAFDYEGTYTRFKTLGAKRYMFEKDGKIHITISGVKKSAASFFTKDEDKDPFELFNNELVIPEEETGKLTHTYIDGECSGTLKDYTGVEAEYHEDGYIHLEPCEYTLGIQSYLDYLKGVHKRK